MSAELAAYAGTEVPRWFDAVFDRDEPRMAVQVRVTIGSKGNLIPSGVMAFGERTFRDALDALKGQPLDDLLHEAAENARRAWRFADFRREQGIEDGKPFTLEQQQDLEQRLATKTGEPIGAPLPRPARQRRVATPDLLREVAEIYRKAHVSGRPPTAAVADHFGVSHRTGTRWVAEARKDGFLGPAIGPVAGEADCPSASE